MRDFSRLLESLNKETNSTHLVNADVELFFAFLLGTVMYPNYAISNKTYLTGSVFLLEMESDLVMSGHFWCTESREAWMCCSIQQGILESNALQLVE